MRSLQNLLCLYALVLASLSLSAPAARAEESAAETYQRSIQFEWEPVPQAVHYELSIKRKRLLGETRDFKTSEAAWQGKLPPGRYEMTVRSLDRRGVPGDWSPPSDFEVGLEKPTITSPKPKETLKVQARETDPVAFAWKETAGALRYDLEIKSSDGAIRLQKSTTATAETLELPVARAYSWQVKAVGADDVANDDGGEFEIIGARLERPVIEAPENEFVRELRWSKPDKTERFQYALSRLDTDGKTWVSVLPVQTTEQGSLDFEPDWPGGRYRLSVRAQAERRPTSPASVLNFRVRGGDRSPAAEFTAEVRHAVDRIDGWYGIASYLVTIVQYSSSNFEPQQAAATSFDAFGGTGRLGLGYMRERKAWGLLAIADLSGFINDQNQNLTYASTELSGVWKTAVGPRGELRIQAGAYYKEEPIALGDPRTLTVRSYTNVAVAGPHLGFEYWYAMTPKLGFQLHLHLYEGMFGLSTPNGQEVVPTLSHQLGFLGSYRLSHRATGLAGYSRRVDAVRYKTTGGTTAANEMNLTGNYVNFFLEYAF